MSNCEFVHSKPYFGQKTFALFLVDSSEKIYEQDVIVDF